MTPFVQSVTQLLALGTALMLALSVAGAILLKSKNFGRLRNRIAPYALVAAFLITLAGTILSLVYSDVWGFVPCWMCWIQRIFLYPIPILIGIALFARDSGVWKYVAGLSIPGLVVALYQHYLQIGGVGPVPCLASPGEADCAQRIIFELGFVTFPLMAAGVFALTLVLALLARKKG